MRDHRHVEPVAVDECSDFITKWYCEPPVGHFFVVREECRHKSGLKPVRRIYEWKEVTR